ncbi:Uncharacterised protein [Halioglobus japonicus]|nr:Uncharacterised protein [Halioglobus japonicus]
MLKRCSTWLMVLLAASVLQACSNGNNNNNNGNDTVTEEPVTEEPVVLPDNVLLFTERDVSNATLLQVIEEGESNPDMRLSGDIDGKPVTIVKLSGKTNHFGRDKDLQYIDYHATVPDTRIWIAEYPETRELDIRTDDTGWWTMYIVKDAGADLEFSFIFEKEDWITTKTNVNIIADEDDTDFAIQFIEPHFFEFAMLPLVEAMMRGNGYPNFFFENAMVVTVGKSWGSMHDDRLPHGDPGATVSITPVSEDYYDPIYFNKDVIPDLAQEDVSVDGGVTWLNMPQEGTYYVTAHKPGVTYPTVKFTFTQADKDAGVVLYIASPPDSLEGDNDSPPGEY